MKHTTKEYEEKYGYSLYVSVEDSEHCTLAMFDADGIVDEISIADTVNYLHTAHLSAFADETAERFAGEQDRPVTEDDYEAEFRHMTEGFDFKAGKVPASPATWEMYARWWIPEGSAFSDDSVITDAGLRTDTVNWPSIFSASIK